MAAADVDEDRVGLDEIYELATNTTNLKHSAERRTSADVLRDVAMSADRLGAALLRLRGQWESAVEPMRTQPRSIKQFYAALHNKAEAEAQHRAEKDKFDSWYLGETAAMIERLTDLPVVRHELAQQAVKWGMGRTQDPVLREALALRRQHDEEKLAAINAELQAAGDDDARQAARARLNEAIIETQARRSAERADELARALPKVTAVIRYWLDQTCPKCEGRKFRLIPGTPSLSEKPCPHPRDGGCGGSGVAPVPEGQEGRRLANHMDQCAFRYKQNIGKRRQLLDHIPPIDRLSKRMQRRYDPTADED